MTIYRTVATELPATPLGLLPARWIIEHWCTTCQARIAADQLLGHAQHHHDDTITNQGGAID